MSENGVVIRDDALLAQGAVLVNSDLARVLGPTWACSHANGELRATNGSSLDVRVPVTMEFDPEDALPAGALESEWRDSELAYDAISAVVDALQWGFEGRVDAWPVCSLHSQTLMTCSGYWVCGKGRHDPAPVGELTAEALS
jgi:hypothetical protein